MQSTRAARVWARLQGKRTPDSRPIAEGADQGYLAERGRDLRIDFLRGYFVFAMVVDHVRGPSWLHVITGGNQFYTSAAEGFIFISGFITGLVYHRFIQRDGLGPSLRRILERAAQLYLLAAGLTLFFVPLSEILALPWAQGVDLSNPLAFIVSAATLHRTYYLVDVPLLYALLFLAAPIALVLLSQGRTSVVLGLSILLWGLYQLSPENAELTWPIAGNYLFNFSAWQILFFVGLVMGYHRDRVGAVLGRLPRRPTLIALTLGLAVLIALEKIVEFAVRVLAGEPSNAAELHPQVQLMMIEVVFGKSDLRPGRLLASAIVFGLFFLLLTEYWQQLRRGLGWLFLPLGERALYAYTAHVLVTAGVALALQPLDLPNLAPAGLNSAVQLASVILIWSLVRFRVLAPTRATQRWWAVSPVAIALGLLVVLPRDPSPTYPGIDAPPQQLEPERARVARALGTPIARVGPGVIAPAEPPRSPRAPGRPPTGTGPAIAPSPAAAAGVVATPEPLPEPATSPSPAAAAGVVATPVPLPEPPSQPAARPAGAEQSASPYLGSIEGLFREVEFYSSALDAEMRYFIYLPPDYAWAGRRYPALYMLHGAAGDKEEWVALGLVDAADRAIRTGDLLPMIIILPDGDMAYWANHAGDGPRWGDYIAEDLVRHVDASYRTLPGSADRAVGGLSMGAWGALHQAFTRPDVFNTVGGHSPALRTNEGWLTFLGEDEEFERKDPISLARTADSIEDLQVWIDIGEDDPWLERAELVHQHLDERGIRHEWHVFPGEHGGEYWEEHALEYLRFYGRALTRR